MNDLRRELERIGLSAYHDVFVAEGFDTWETLQDITESDLEALQVKIGHRRKLQRAIVEWRSNARNRRDENRPKRQYRRHPKLDENGPVKPPSAYVLFSNDTRESLKNEGFNFTQLAKITGERWQSLPSDVKDRYHREASARKERYNAELAEYKKTPEYRAHQKYLEEFKAKQAESKGATRARKQRKDSTASAGYGRGDGGSSRQSGAMDLDMLPEQNDGGTASPATSLSRFPGYMGGSKSATPVPVEPPLSTPDLVRPTEYGSPQVASPWSSPGQPHDTYNIDPSLLPHEQQPLNTSMTLPPISHSAHYGVNPPFDQSLPEHPRLAPIDQARRVVTSGVEGGYEARYLPSPSGQSGSSQSLLQPAPSLGPTLPPLDSNYYISQASSPQQSHYEVAREGH